MSKKKKKPTNTFNPDTSKIPKIAPQNEPEKLLSKKPVWRLGMLDKDGEWGWEHIDAKEIILEIHNKLSSFETMTWTEIENKKGKKGKYNHSIPVKEICKGAKDRLREIELDDIDMLYSLHLSSRKRIWGKRDNEAFYIIWWDPDHTVCEVRKNHT